MRRRDDVGYPVLVKAAAGGGGKGMRIVESRRRARRGGRRGAPRGRRRVRRRHACSSSATSADRATSRSRSSATRTATSSTSASASARSSAATRRSSRSRRRRWSTTRCERRWARRRSRLAKAIGYQSAGTVEFLVDDDTRRVLLPRGQHPAAGRAPGHRGGHRHRPRPRAAAHRRGRTARLRRRTTSTFRGHAIEARLYAEDPAGGVPARHRHARRVRAGRRARGALGRRASRPARWSASTSTRCSPRSSPTARPGPRRRGRLALALERLHLGGVTTNRDFLVATLRHPAFLAGDTTTDFIDRHDPPPTSRPRRRRPAVASPAVAALWLQGVNRASATVLADVPSGWRNARLPAQDVTLAHGDDRIERRATSRDATARSRIGDGIAVVSRAGPPTASMSRSTAGVQRAPHQQVGGAAVRADVPRGTVDLDVVPRFVAPGDTEQRGGFVAADARRRARRPLRAGRLGRRPARRSSCSRR